MKTWVCQGCRWDAGPQVLKASDACDSCGGELVCSECWDYPEDCGCFVPPNPDGSAGHFAPPARALQSATIEELREAGRTLSGDADDLYYDPVTSPERAQMFILAAEALRLIAGGRESGAFKDAAVQMVSGGDDALSDYAYDRALKMMRALAGSDD